MISFRAGSKKHVIEHGFARDLGEDTKRMFSLASGTKQGRASARERPLLRRLRVAARSAQTQASARIVTDVET